MSAPTGNSPFFTWFFEEAVNPLQASASDMATVVGTTIAPVVQTLLAIYIMMWGWAMIRGMVEEPVLDGLGRIVRLSVIVALAVGTSHYQDIIAKAIWGSGDAMANAIVSGTGKGAADSNYLDTAWKQIDDKGEQYRKKAWDRKEWGIPDLSLWASAWLIWLSGGALTGYAFFLTLLAKFAIAVLIAIGPIFIIGLMFDGT